MTQRKWWSNRKSLESVVETPQTKKQVTNEEAVQAVANLLRQLADHDEEDSFCMGRRMAVENAMKLLGLAETDVDMGKVR